MLPDNAIRNLRQAAWILRGTDLWDDTSVDELRTIAARLEQIAARFEDRLVDAPAQAAACG
jgi:hypothetical protein